MENGISTQEEFTNVAKNVRHNFPPTFAKGFLLRRGWGGGGGVGVRSYVRIIAHVRIRRDVITRIVTNNNFAITIRKKRNNWNFQSIIATSATIKLISIQSNRIQSLPSSLPAAPAIWNYLFFNPPMFTIYEARHVFSICVCRNISAA